MKHTLASLKTALATAPAHSVKLQLCRLVPFEPLAAHRPPRWLCTSGKANRYNPAGVDCVYFSESSSVAQAEYQRMWKGTPGAKQPVVTYHAEVSLGRILDLTDAKTLEHLKIARKDLLKTWRTARSPTVTQLIGKAVSETAKFAAIRYPSVAATGRGKAAANLVIFRDCVRSPDSVRILGPDDKVPLDEWP